jgi:hypothetical protein
MMSSPTSRSRGSVGRPAPASLGEPLWPRPERCFSNAVTRNDHRGHQQPRRCPPGDHLSALRLEARHRQSAPRYVDRPGRPAAHRPRTPQRCFTVCGARPDQAPRGVRWRHDRDVARNHPHPTTDLTSPSRTNRPVDSAGHRNTRVAHPAPSRRRRPAVVRATRRTVG